MRWVVRVLAALVGFIVLVLLNLRTIVPWFMTPGEPFDPAKAPPAPDYASPASWSALPEREDAGDPAPDGDPGIDPQAARADVFYVHPTSYVGAAWNGPVDDPALNEATDRVATGIQATAFNRCCAVYAPRYRQANGMAFPHPSADGERAIDLAYGDVRRAFQEFLRRRAPGRPLLLAGHSQGSMLAARLLEEEIAGTPLQELLVAAYLPGGPVTVDGLQERGLRACAAPDDLGCVAAWDARGPRYVPGDFEMRRPDTRRKLCTNPLTWRLDGAPAPASMNLGAVFLETAERAPRPAFADATCEGGTLIVRELGPAPRDLPSRILDHVMGPESYHPIEYQIFFMNLRRNAEERVEAWLRRATP